MRPDKRAVLIAGAAVAAGGVLGYLGGAGPGVILTFAGVITAAILQVALNRQDLANARRKRSEEAGKAYAPRVITVADAAGGGVARYLRPEAEAVRFWPRPELDELVRWVVSEERVAVRLVTGAGGSGKTRLARQLGAQVGELGWRSYWAYAGQEADAVAVAREERVPVLLIADYAETRAGLAALAAAAGGWDGPTLRILLLARSSGEWWQQLQDSVPDGAVDLLTAAESMTLGPIAVGSDLDRVYGDALAAFAALRGVVCPDASLRLADPDAVVLVVHAAALLSVLDAEGATDTGVDDAVGGDVLGGLLRHERRYWRQSLASRVVVPLDPDVIDRAVTVGCLIGAGDQDAAMRLLEVIPDLGDGELRGKVARWLHDLYPVPAQVSGGEWIGQLQPDLLAERLVVSVLARHRRLIPRLFTGLSQARARRALTILSRAALTQPAVMAQLQQALQADPEHLLVPAVAVTAETNPALARLIMGVLAAVDVPVQTLAAVAVAIPYPTVALAELSVAVIRQIVDTLPPAATPAERASWLSALGTALAQLGRPADALPVTEKAVAIYRELVAASPNRHRPDLAHVLSNLGVRLGELGRPAEALSVTEEAVAIRRELAAVSPDRYGPDLAASLTNLGVRLWEVGRPAEALSVTEEAVAIYRELAAVSPDRYGPDLAASLTNLGVFFSQLGRPAEALPVSEQAVAIRRELAAASPDRYRPDLAASLSNLAGALSGLGREADTLSVAQEAVANYRDLAAASPDRYRAGLANSLGNLSGALSALGREADLSVAQEAVAIYRDLAAASPDRYRPDLARSLFNLGLRLSALGRPSDALPVTREAVAIRRELAAASPDRYRPDLADSLAGLGVMLSMLDRKPDALPVVQEAAATYRDLAASLGRRHRLDPVRSLSNLAAILTDLGWTDEAETILKGSGN